MRIFILFILTVTALFAADNYNLLTPQEKHVIVDKGTERPFSGKYNDFFQAGSYLCKRCDTPLYRSDDKFKSHCGWPSFDDEIKGAVKRIPDPDGYRTEIVCANCGAHLGHVFKGEQLTKKNLRHCVNSVSLKFVPDVREKTAYFAGGCFWGVEYHFEKLKGVSEVVSGYMGGQKKNPTYRQVTRGTTGHVETVKVTYDPSQVSFETLARLFFEIHDPEQRDGQGPDIGSQYLSVVFYNDEAERAVTEKLIGILEKKGMNVATSVKKVTPFYKAEDYHQDYYKRTGKQPYCHTRVKLFD